MESLRVVRWQRHGHDRLYVHAGEDELGWVDLKTGRIHAKTNRSWSTSADRAVAEWKSRNPTDQPRADFAAGPAVTCFAESRRSRPRLGQESGWREPH